MTLTDELVTLADQIANAYFLPGGDVDDVRQEARIAAWQALTVYDPDAGVPLRAFVGMVIHRRVRSAVTSARALKHQMISGIPLDPHEHTVDDPLAQVIAIEELRRIRRQLRYLTPLERRSLAMVLNGEVYVDDKSVDNAVQRARIKLAA